MTHSADIPAEWRGILSRDERVLWQGAPANDEPYEKSGVISVLFGLIFMVGAPIFLFRNLGDEDSATSVIFIVLIGLAVIGIGAWDFFGRSMFASYKLRHAFFTLTSRRAYTGWHLFGRQRLESWTITKRTKIELKTGYFGSVYFAEKIHREKNTSWTEKIGFLNIRDAKDVYELMLKVQQGTA